MPKSRHAILTIFLALLAIAGSIVVGQNMRKAAIDAWEQDARNTTAKLTETAAAWVTTLERDLRSIAVVYHASSDVSEDELLDAVELISTGPAAIPLASVAYAEKDAQGVYQIRTLTAP
tara:strand:- start:323 stop:679 length:357 start_codon:yes stop_codon:yes gene_type:complete